MCLILFSYKSHPEYPLIIASNRDESYERPASPAAFWKETPDMLAGRDLKECGTWLGMTKSGRIATITNFREPHAVKDDAPSRGELLINYLRSRDNPTHYIQKISKKAHMYNGFNLVFGYLSDLYYFSNRGADVQKVSPGLHGLSNHLLDTPWPKVKLGMGKLDDLISGNNNFTLEAVFNILADISRPDDTFLPDTGVGIERERMLSPIFVRSPDYGTRSSTVILVDKNYHVTFVEKIFNGTPDQYEEKKFEFTIESGQSI
jgi:uncharacterized protein with NRDE domain